jgi:hypothetical protein
VNAGRTLEILGFNILLLLALYLVTADVATRSAYAAREGLSYTFAQSFLVETSTLGGKGLSLQSPLSIAWLQLILLVLVVVDALYVYDWAKNRRAKPVAAA